MTQHSNLSPEQLKRLNETFPAVTSIAKWAGNNDVRWFGEIAYVCCQAAGLFYYFGKYEEGYKFIISYSQDLGELR